MGWAAAAAAVGSVASGVIAGDAAGAAADVQAEASRYAADLQMQTYQQTRNDLSPFVRAGTGGLNLLSSLIPGGLKLGPQPTGTGTIPDDPANPKTISVDAGPAGQIQVPNPNYDPTKPNPNGPQGFELDKDIAPSQFLTNLESFLPGSGTAPELDALRAIAPGGDDPLLSALRGYIPGSGEQANPLLAGMMNFIPGASATPDASLTALRGFIPGGGTENPLLKRYNELLGLGGDPASIQAALEATPGYKFTRDQGLKSVQNSFAAKGLGNSGAALRGAGDYVTGLADTTYEQRLANYANAYNSQFTNTYNAYNSQFSNNLNAYNTSFANTYNTVGQQFNNALNNYSTKFTNSYNAYGQQLNAAQNLVSGGQNAAAQVGTIGQGTSQAVGNTLTSGAAAQAAGIVGSANATANAITGVTNAGTALALFNNPGAINALTGGKGTGTGTPAGMYSYTG